MQIQFTSPSIIAHRGASAHAPENTLAAFRKAMELDADGIELDVHLSVDGEIVVIHDADLSRTTNGQGKVHQTPLAQLRQLDAGGEPVPLLEEVLQLLDDRTLLNIELKGTDTQLPHKVIQLVANHHKENQIIYSSFNPFLLKQINKISPQAAVGLLLPPGTLGKIIQWIFAPRLKLWSLHPHQSLVTLGYMEKAKQMGCRVIAYTVNQPADIQKLLHIGIDGIITDDPAGTAAVVEAYNSTESPDHLSNRSHSA